MTQYYLQQVFSLVLGSVTGFTIGYWLRRIEREGR